MSMSRREHTVPAKWLRGRSHGQASIEFVLMVVFVMLLIVGSIELIMVIYTYNVLADSAKEGVRYAIVHGTANTSPSGPTTGAASNPPCTKSSANVTAVQGVVKDYAKYSMHDISAMTVNVCYYDGTNKDLNRVEVVVHYPFQPLFGLGWPKVTVNAAAEGRIVY